MAGQSVLENQSEDTDSENTKKTKTSRDSSVAVFQRLRSMPINQNCNPKHFRQRGMPPNAKPKRGRPKRSRLLEIRGYTEIDTLQVRVEAEICGEEWMLDNQDNGWWMIENWYGSLFVVPLFSPQPKLHSSPAKSHSAPTSWAHLHTYKHIHTHNLHRHTTLTTNYRNDETNPKLHITPPHT